MCVFLLLCVWVGLFVIIIVVLSLFNFLFFFLLQIIYYLMWFVVTDSTRTKQQQYQKQKTKKKKNVFDISKVEKRQTCIYWIKYDFIKSTNWHYKILHSHQWFLTTKLLFLSWGYIFLCDFAIEMSQSHTTTTTINRKWFKRGRNNYRVSVQKCWLTKKGTNNDNKIVFVSSFFSNLFCS